MDHTTYYVFVSSTFDDLQPERQAVKDALLRVWETRPVGMEEFGSNPGDTRQTSLQKLDRCHVYIGIFGGRYGSGITDDEYTHAAKRGIPRFIYLKDPAVIPPHQRETDPEGQEKLRRLIDHVRQEHSIDRPFATPDQLAMRVMADMQDWLSTQQVAASVRRPAATEGGPPTPFQAGSLPADCVVPRPEITEPLKQQLLAETSDTGVLVVTAVHGLPGVGKTTVAALVARDDRVRRYFRDGVLWATLGQNPDVLDVLARWLYSLGELDFRPSDISVASQHLQDIARDRTMLLVVDDAWQYEHVRPFLVGGPRCRTLITTRNADVVGSTRPNRVDLPVMQTHESLAVLCGKVGRQLKPEERERALAVAEEVGHLPLALDLAGARLRPDEPSGQVHWDQYLAELRDEKTRLTKALELPEAARTADEAAQKGLSLRASFRLSLRDLSDEQRERFAWLGLLPEDVEVSPAMAATLWGTDKQASAELLKRFRAQALLMPGVAADADDPSYRVHDLVHDMARRMLSSPPEPESPLDLPGLGIPLSVAHRRLLARYRERTRDGKWWNLEADSYVHRHLTWHMQNAGMVNEVHELLLGETAEGRNGWYEACNDLMLVPRYLADVDLAWCLAEQRCGGAFAPKAPDAEGHLDTENLSHDVTRCCRYALITASFRSLAAAIPPPLLRAVVARGLWSPSQGLAYARQVVDPRQRAAALAELAAEMADDSLEHVMKAAEDIPDESARAAAIANVAVYLPKTLRGATLEAALGKAQCIGSNAYQGEVLHQLTARLAELGHADEAFTVALSVREVSQRTAAIRGIPGRLPRPLVHRSLEVAESHPPGPTRDDLLLGAVIRLTTEGDDAAAIGALEQMTSGDRRAQAALVLVEHLPYTMLDAIAPAVHGLPDTIARSRCLANISQRRLDQGDYEAALRTAQEIGDDAVLVEALGPISAVLPARLLAHAIDAVHGLSDPRLRGMVLADLLPRLPDDLLGPADDIARRVHDERLQGFLLGQLVERTLNVGDLIRALDIATAISDDALKTEPLSALVSTALAQNNERIAVRAARAMPKGDARIHAIRSLLRSAAAQGSDRGFRILLRLLGSLDLTEMVQLCRDFAAASGPAEDWARLPVRVRLVLGVARWLGLQIGMLCGWFMPWTEPPGWLLAAVEEAVARGYPLPHLPEDEAQVAGSVMEVLATGIASSAPGLDRAGVVHAYRWGLSLRNHRARARLLTELIHRLGGARQRRAIRVACTSAARIEDPSDREEALCALAPFLAHQQRKALVTDIQARIRSRFSRANLRYFGRRRPPAHFLRPNEQGQIITWVTHLIALGATGEALSLVSRMTFGFRWEILLHVLPLLPEPLRRRTADDMWLRAHGEPQTRNGVPVRASMLAQLSVQFAAAGYAAEAGDAARAPRYGGSYDQWASTLATLLPLLPDTTRRECVDQFLSSYADQPPAHREPSSVPGARALIETLAHTGECERAVAFLAMLDGGSPLEDITAATACALASVGDPAHALEAASMLDGGLASAKLHLRLAALLRGQLREQALAVALTAIDEAPDVPPEVATLAGLARESPELLSVDACKLAVEFLDQDNTESGELDAHLCDLVRPATAMCGDDAAADIAVLLRDPCQRARTVLPLVLRCSANRRRELMQVAVEALKSLRDKQARVQHGLLALAFRLPDAIQAEILEAAAALTQDDAFEAADNRLRRLAVRLINAGHPRAALTVSGLVTGAQSRMALTGAIAEAFARAGDPDIGLQALLATPHGRGQDEALADFASAVTRIGQGNVAAKAIGAMQNQSRMADAITELSPHLTRKPLRKCLALALEMEQTDDLLRAVSGLAPWLPEELLQRALDATCVIEDALDCSTASLTLFVQLLRLGAIEQAHRVGQCLAALLETPLTLDGPPLRDVLEFIGGLPTESLRAEALCALAGHLPRELIRSALQLAERIGSDSLRADVILALARSAPAGGAADIMVAVTRLGDQSLQAQMVFPLIETLGAGALPGALAVVEAMTDEEHKEQLLDKLVPQAPPFLWWQVLRAGQSLQSSSARVRFLRRIAPKAHPDVMPWALAMARRITHPGRRSRALVALAPFLPPSCLRRAIDAARRIGKARVRGRALIGLLPHLPHDLRALAYQAIRQSHNKDARAESLLASIPHLPEPLANQAFQEGLDAVEAAHNPARFLPAIAELAPVLSERQVQRAVRVAASVAPARTLRRFLRRLRQGVRADDIMPTPDGQPLPPTALPPHPGPAVPPRPELPTEPEEALSEFARLVRRPEHVTELHALADSLSHDLLARAIRDAVAMPDPRIRWRALNTLVPCAMRLPSAVLADWLFGSTRAEPNLLRMASSRPREQFLRDLCDFGPLLAKIAGSDTVERLVQCISDVGRWWP